MSWRAICSDQSSLHAQQRQREGAEKGACFCVNEQSGLPKLPQKVVQLDRKEAQPPPRGLAEAGLLWAEAAWQD